MVYLFGNPVPVALLLEPIPLFRVIHTEVRFEDHPVEVVLSVALEVFPIGFPQIGTEVYVFFAKVCTRFCRMVFSRG